MISDCAEIATDVATVDGAPRRKHGRDAHATTDQRDDRLIASLTGGRKTRRQSVIVAPTRFRYARGAMSLPVTLSSVAGGLPARRTVRVITSLSAAVFCVLAMSLFVASRLPRRERSAAAWGAAVLVPGVIEPEWLLLLPAAMP
jgi:hypothetical protein